MTGGVRDAHTHRPLWSHLDRLVRPQGSMDKPQSISPRSSALRALTGGYLNGTLRVLFWRGITTHENVVQSMRCRALSNA